jgi:hypothetical protein
MATNTDRVLDFLRLIAPRRATNEEICARTSVRPHQQVFQITKRLCDEGVVRSIRAGKEWEFWVEKKNAPRPAPKSVTNETASAEVQPGSHSTMARLFEEAARQAMSTYLGMPLKPGSFAHVPKVFDYVSQDRHVVGDAKFYTLVGGVGTPPAKNSIIAEHVWLLEKTGAATKFLVFGNDRRVPEQWLKRYRELAQDISFFFLAADGKLDRLR